MGCRPPLPAYGLEFENFNDYDAWAETSVRIIKTYIQEKAQDTLSSKCVEFKNSVKTSVTELEDVPARIPDLPDCSRERCKGISEAGETAGLWAPTLSHPRESLPK